MTELLISAFIKNKDDLKNHKVRQAYGTMGGAVGIFCRRPWKTSCDPSTAYVSHWQTSVGAPVNAPTPGSSRHAIRCSSCRPAKSAACRSSNMLPTYGPLRRTDLASCICTCRTPPMRTRSCLRSILARTPSNSCTMSMPDRKSVV